jgi:hypothetical protein
MDMLASEEYEKALSPMVFTLCGIVIESSVSQPLNAA